MAIPSAARAAAEPRARPEPAERAVGAPTGAAAAPDRTLVVATYNVLHGGVTSGWTGADGDLDRRLEIAAAELSSLAPDVVGIQEASAGPGRGNVAERLAASLGMQFLWAPALFAITPWQPFNDFVGWLMRLSEGPAVLARFPIVAGAALELPRCSGLFDVRALAHADVQTPWGVMPVFSTHLSWGACEAAKVARLVRERRRLMPGVLLGDFNAVASSPAVARLVRDAGLVDAFRAANPEAAGATVWQRTSSRERTARRRVDFVFVVPGTEATFEVLESRVVLDEPHVMPDGGFVWPSDHYGVVARLRLVPLRPDARGP